jgi:hypothetical protein
MELELEALELLNTELSLTGDCGPCTDCTFVTCLESCDTCTAHTLMM